MQEAATRPVIWLLVISFLSIAKIAASAVPAYNNNNY